ncbi:hypothetical protein C8Q79DRAFT_1008631 [Trametes meyenii]|nr:hypothetical protein C8Q79DRAFT_1008631 [Trametes meyenii]
MGLADALKVWSEVCHNYSLSVIGSGTILLNGGIESAFNTPRVLFVRLRPQKLDGRDDSEHNPAKTFVIHGVELVDKKELGPAIYDWGEWTGECRRIANVIRETTIDPTHNFVGVLPTLHMVTDTGLATCNYTPVYGRALESRMLVDGRIREVVRDVVDLCLGATTSGITFAPPTTIYSELVPRVEFTVKRGKKWVRESAAAWNWDDAGNLLLQLRRGHADDSHRPPASSETQKPPPDFNQIWATWYGWDVG